jgi:hypothetical protein
VTIRNTQKSLLLEKTIFIVATKSGGTVETLSLFKYFYNLVDTDPKIQSAGAHFIAITDPGSRLDKLATELSFHKIFMNNPNLGGRYSALSYFGLVPAACLGVDLPKLLDSSKSASQKNSADKPANHSTAAKLGAFIAAGFNAGKDKLTFISSPEINSFSDWVEQLVAESTGKIGKGILPVVGEPVADDLAAYGNDRIFVIQQFGHTHSLETLADQLKNADFPVIECQIQEPYQLGELILTWEIATAIAGHLIGINPFDQPDVESAKVIARQSVQAYQETGELPQRVIELASAEKITGFLENISSHDYISLHAYLPSDPEIETVFRRLQANLRDRYKVAVTFGFGPRFLHSTGQLHKGDRGNGFFIQLVTTAVIDLDIPDYPGKLESGISFDTLKQAQAIGDGAALKSKNRKLIILSINTPLLASLMELVESL